jgi:tetratricopeptide (TPR) repeat protein
LDKYAHDNLGSLYLDWKKYDDAVGELEKARSLTPNNPELNVELGRAYLNVGQNDKAQQVFEKAVELAPRPMVWNNIAYQLAEKRARLALAQQYAESAIAATAAASRNITLEQVTQRDLAIAYSLLSYWDTLGWVYFAKGDLDKSQKYIQAAWLNTGRSDVGKHLGEIYEKLGQKDLAIQTYATAAVALYPEPEITEKLIVLTNMKDVSSLLDKNRAKLQQIRTIHLGKIAKVTGSADFLVLLGASGAESVKFVSGEIKLKELQEALRNAKYGLSFPEDTPAKLIRRGTLTCSAKDDTCEFVLLFPDDVHSVD